MRDAWFRPMTRISVNRPVQSGGESHGAEQSRPRSGVLLFRYDSECVFCDQKGVE